MNEDDTTYPPTKVPKMSATIAKSILSRKVMKVSSELCMPCMARIKEDKEGDGFEPA
ncbi:hypothetical protein H0H81_006705 [Sphagnurus paluster]|uniref:Uncharacterized protein n=1 Tax=Sphagnurus paluster TaxID=117069 RepID=A0A9P7K5K1_9AGAR|nr:hypothetical protein H0H81_006705 [Sphagnurus paluster]